MLLNELNKRGYKYEILKKEYHWCHTEDTPIKAKGSGDCLGIHIVVKLNDRYNASIIYAFNEAIGEFYGDDIYDLAFVDVSCGNWDLLKEFEIGVDGMFTNACICNGSRVIEYIEKFVKERLET